MGRQLSELGIVRQLGLKNVAFVAVIWLVGIGLIALDLGSTLSWQRYEVTTPATVVDLHYRTGSLRGETHYMATVQYNLQDGSSTTSTAEVDGTTYSNLHVGSPVDIEYKSASSGAEYIVVHIAGARQNSTMVLGIIAVVVGALALISSILTARARAREAAIQSG